jgi:NADPH:quinone reductase
VLVRHRAVGVNFSDINVRRGGFYQSIRKGLDQAFPLILGNEAAGVVDAIGDRSAGCEDLSDPHQHDQLV